MAADLLFEIRHAPVDDLDRLETLEPILAAAALELGVDVLFLGAGTGHLAGPGSERWDQLVDFGLGRLWVTPGSNPAPGRAEPVEEIEQLRRRARKLVEL